MERVVLNALRAAALPPDICAINALICHRLEDKTIHLVDNRRACDEIADAEDENQIGNRKHPRGRRLG